MKLEKHANGTWYARAKVGGKWTRKSLRTQSKREAQRRLAALDLSPSPESLGEAVQRWLNEQEERDLTPRHLTDLRLIARELATAFGGLGVAELRRTPLLKWLQEKPRRLRFARAFFRWAIAEDLRATDPLMGAAAYLQKPEPKRTPRLSDAQIEALIAALVDDEPRLVRVVRFLAETGIRSVDAARLKWKDIGPGRALIRPGRGKGHTRLIPIPPLDLPPGPPESAVFGMTKRQLEYRWHKFKQRNPDWGGVSLHSLRVSLNSRLVERGNEALARAMLGHASVDMTAHYTRLVGS